MSSVDDPEVADDDLAEAESAVVDEWGAFETTAAGVQARPPWLSSTKIPRRPNLSTWTSGWSMGNRSRLHNGSVNRGEARGLRGSTAMWRGSMS